MVVVACFATASAAMATPLPPSGVTIPVSAEPDPTGGVIIASMSTPFSIAGSYSGDLISEVISGDPSNPLGGLTFTYCIVVNTGPNSVSNMTVQNWGGFLADASYKVPLPPGDIAPAVVTRNPAGSVISWSFFPIPQLDPNTGFLVAGTKSPFLVLQSDAPNYELAFAAFNDGGITTASTFGPSVVPEPSTVALALTGVGLILSRLGFRRVRKGRQA
ncbi:MAG: PEP-CTERM sorting domain-containing protein [Pirellulales bacterium]|nr:PEP-CTERM sorting domain-containing protein [Pirellulales bacterium]